MTKKLAVFLVSAHAAHSVMLRTLVEPFLSCHAIISTTSVGHLLEREYLTTHSLEM
jgi:hypothetical protein